jgi:carbon-monoxide dehydrogenase medium subunit
MVVEVNFPPMPPGSCWAIQEIARRPGDYALAGVAVLVTLDDGGRCQQARLAFFGVGEGPVQAHHAARRLTGETPIAELIADAAETAATLDIDPASDIHATAAFRRHLARVLSRRALAEAFYGGGRLGDCFSQSLNLPIS